MYSSISNSNEQINEEKRTKYPKAVCFILTLKFFEAFAANGIRTVLALYLNEDLGFSESISIVTLHVFNFFGQFCPILGAIIADSYLGNTNTISSFSIIYTCGWILLLLSSIPGTGLTASFVVIIALIFIATGNGAVRACVTSLGALQFKLPEQAKQLAGYFSIYYIVYYGGIFLSKLLPPLVRVDTKCFDKIDCYPAVFGMLATSLFLGVGSFLCGRRFYKLEKINKNNILLKFFFCIKDAVVLKWKNRQQEEKKYWLHYATERYETAFVNDVSKVLRLCKLFLPLPVYFALLAQQDSTWTFQAKLMNTTIGGITIEPDQAKAVGPVFLYLLIPLWQFVVRPFLKNCFGFELSAFQSVFLGGVVSALSFICAANLEQQISQTFFKDISILWQMPQFLFIMMGELWLSIPGLQFAFEHAPQSLKSVVTAMWFLNNALGNLIVIIITELHLFSKARDLYYFYAFMMIISIIIFKFLADAYEKEERVGYRTATENKTENDLEQQPLLQYDLGTFNENEILIVPPVIEDF